MWGRARVPGAWGDTGEVPGSRATARGVAGGRFARTLPPMSRLLAAPEACARTARKMKKGGRETSVRMRNGGGGGEGSSERRETRALCSGHATGSELGRRPDSSARGVFQTRPPGRISRGFFLADARKPKRTSRSFQREGVPHFAPSAQPRRAETRARARERRFAAWPRGCSPRGIRRLVGDVKSGPRVGLPQRDLETLQASCACSNGIENLETLN